MGRRIGVGLIFALAGGLFTTSAQTAGGDALRPDSTSLAQLVQSATQRVSAQAEAVRMARQQVQELQEQRIEQPTISQDRAMVRAQAGLDPLIGSGLTVTLDDAPASATALGFDPDDLIVHQGDVQAVVNALWLAGAKGMMIQDQRLISTSAVRCVGNTLILQGRVYSPPFTITAVGDPEALEAGLEKDSRVQLYRDYVQAVGLGYDVTSVESVRLPSFDGSTSLKYAVPAASD